MSTQLTLNEDQQAAHDALLAHVLAKEGQGSAFCVLTGFAGTGKSTTVSHVLEQAAKSKTVWVTAPTHKAVTVLERMGVRRPNVKYATIHSALGLTLRTRDDEQILARGGPLAVQDGEVVIIDEGSMLGAPLVQHIRGAASRRVRSKWIVVGDPFQLPPVGESKSDAFSLGKRHDLSNIVRQAEDNPILAFCKAIRDSLANGARLPSGEFLGETNASGGVHTIDSARWWRWLSQAFKHGGRFDDDSDSVRVIAWRNRTVDRVNQFIRDQRYPGLETPFAVGETVIFGDAVKASACEGAEGRKRDEIVIANQMEGKVTAISPANHPSYTYPAWSVRVAAGTGETKTVYALDPGALRLWQRDLNEHAHNKAWKSFWGLRAAYADLRMAYAVTAHKSQGSTFNSVFVMPNDILANRNREEALRCLYVAYSRASEHVAALSE